MYFAQRQANRYRKLDICLRKYFISILSESFLSQVLSHTSNKIFISEFCLRKQICRES